MMTSRHVESPDAWQTKLQEWSKWSFPWFWLVIAMTLFVAGVIVLWQVEESFSNLSLLALQTLLIASTANGVVFCERLLDETADSFELLFENQKQEVSVWMDSWYNTIFSLTPNVLVGLAMGALLTVSGWLMISDLFTSWPALALACLYNFILGIHSGSFLWIMIGVARLMMSLGKNVSIRVSIFDSTTSPLRSASGVLWRISLVAALIYVLSITTCTICDIELRQANVDIVLVFGIFLIAYFIIPQLNIHRRLSTIKQQKLSALVEQIDHAFDVVTKDPSSRNIQQLRQLFDIQRVVNGKRAWSFGTNELLLLIGTILVPLGLVIVKHLFDG